MSKRKLGKHKIKANINRLFRNEGENTFVDITESSGVLNDGFSLAAIILDVNNDGWDDIFVSNDFVTSSTSILTRKTALLRRILVSILSTKALAQWGSM